MAKKGAVPLGDGLVLKGTKTHQARRVGLDAGTVAALRAQVERNEKAAAALGVARVADPYVFGWDAVGSRPIAPGVVTNRYRRLAAKHAPGSHLHDLRHFTASQLLAAGEPVKTVSGRLGHGSAAMTLDVYGHHVGAADQGAADRIGDLLDG